MVTGIVLAVAVLTLLLFIAVTSIGIGPQREVPNTFGKGLSVATSMITTSGFRVAGVKYDPQSKATSGSVIAQHPIAGTRMKPGADVVLTVAGSARVVTAPRQASIPTAMTTANTATTANPTATAAAPTSAASGTTTTSSGGTSTATVPDVVGMVDSFAKKKLEAAGLKYEIANIADTTQKDGVVLACEPAPGTTVGKDSMVKITVNSPPKSIKLTNYAGMKEADVPAGPAK